jgi:hypothetical protein
MSISEIFSISSNDISDGTFISPYSFLLLFKLKLLLILSLWMMLKNTGYIIKILEKKLTVVVSIVVSMLS